MALEAVVFPQDLFGYNGKDLYSLFGGNWSCEFGLEKEDEKSRCFDILENQTETSHHYENWNNSPPPPSTVPHLNEWQQHQNSSPEGLIPKQVPEFDSTLPTAAAASSSSRPKRRRSKSKKNQEEIENQRMTHIAVERNRRKQMNEYLSVLRSLMPESYVQRVYNISVFLFLSSLLVYIYVY